MLEHSTPAEEGSGCESSWDTRILKHVLETKFGIIMSRSGITDILKRWGSASHVRFMPIVRNKKNSNEN